MTLHLRNDITQRTPALTHRPTLVQQHEPIRKALPEDRTTLRQHKVGPEPGAQLVLADRRVPSSQTTALACGATSRAAGCPPRQPPDTGCRSPRPLPSGERSRASRPGCLLTAHPFQPARWPRPEHLWPVQRRARGRSEGPFQAGTAEHSRCHPEKPAARALHALPHLCLQNGWRAHSPWEQPLAIWIFPVKSLVPVHQLFQVGTAMRGAQEGAGTLEAQLAGLSLGPAPR